MIVRKTAVGDIPAAMSIYEQARNYMKEHGNPTQWAGGYPPLSLIEDDVDNGRSFVVEDEGEIVCVFAFLEGPDPTYINIYEGEWLNDKPYSVIHRIAVSSHRRGVASFVFEWAVSRCHNLKIDTHRDNIPMQNSLKKNGFIYCGIIYLGNGDERIAFQKTEEN